MARENSIQSLQRALEEAEQAGDSERAALLLGRLAELHRERIAAQ